MELVTIKHPHPEVAESQVPESAVDIWRKAGWLTEAEYDAQQADQADPPRGDAAPAKPAVRSRRTTEEK